MPEHVETIVSADDSEIHHEPHIRGRRITVRDSHARVEERGLRPETVADRFDLSRSEVYHALAYYHDHPKEMREADRRHEDAANIARTHLRVGDISDCPAAPR